MNTTSVKKKLSEILGLDVQIVVKKERDLDYISVRLEKIGSGRMPVDAIHEAFSSIFDIKHIVKSKEDDMIQLERFKFYKKEL